MHGSFNLRSLLVINRAVKHRFQGVGDLFVFEKAWVYMAYVETEMVLFLKCVSPVQMF